MQTTKSYLSKAFPKINFKMSSTLSKINFNTLKFKPITFSTKTRLIDFPKANLSTKTLGSSVTFITRNNSEKVLHNNVDLSRYSSEGRPLVIFLPWLNSTHSGVKRYITFYTDQGFDVLQIRINSIEFALASSHIDPIVQNQILPTLESSNHERKIIHGFSVGGSLFGFITKHMMEDPSRYTNLVKTIHCQIWDSFVETHQAKNGIIKSAFPNSKYLQTLSKKCLEFYWKRHPEVFKSMEESAHIFRNKPLNVPALFFYSKADHIGTFEANEGAFEDFRKHGVQCVKKVWDDSPHVLHMKTYPNEYQQILKNFIDTYSHASCPRSENPITEDETTTVSHSLLSKHIENYKRNYLLNNSQDKK